MTLLIKQSLSADEVQEIVYRKTEVPYKAKEDGSGFGLACSVLVGYMHVV